MQSKSWIHDWSLLQAHMQSQLGQPINPPMDEMPDASDLGACENLPDMDLEKLDDGESG